MIGFFINLFRIQYFNDKFFSYEFRASDLYALCLLSNFYIYWNDISYAFVTFNNLLWKFSNKCNGLFNDQNYAIDYKL
jgi:hypothetical protein